MTNNTNNTNKRGDKMARYKLYVGGEVERICYLKEVNRLLMAQNKEPLQRDRKTIVVSDTVTAVRCETDQEMVKRTGRN